MSDPSDIYVFIFAIRQCNAIRCNALNINDLYYGSSKQDGKNNKLFVPLCLIDYIYSEPVNDQPKRHLDENELRFPYIIHRISRWSLHHQLCVLHLNSPASKKYNTKDMFIII